MAKSKVSRREFLRLAGVGGAGLAGAVVLARSPKRLEDLVNSPAGKWQRPWWVRSADRPTTGVDWDRVQRYDERNTMRRGHQKYVGKEEYDRLAKVDAKNKQRKLLDNVPATP